MSTAHSLDGEMGAQSSTPAVNIIGRCHLLELPRELRDNIVEEVLIFDDEYPAEVNWHYDDVEEFKQPPLSLVNR